MKKDVKDIKGVKEDIYERLTKVEQRLNEQDLRSWKEVASFKKGNSTRE